MKHLDPRAKMPRPRCVRSKLHRSNGGDLGRCHRQQGVVVCTLKTPNLVANSFFVDDSPVDGATSHFPIIT